MSSSAKPSGNPTDGNLSPRQQAELIASVLAVILEPVQIFEIRALKVQAKYGRPATFAGFFRADQENLVKAALAVVNLAPAKGVYFTINPVNPDLLARRCNRLDRADDGELTKDKDITARRYLLIDVDPIRDAHISATDAEKQSAINKAIAIRDYLHDRGWPDPILCDSGNGAHLLFRIALPADDNGLVERVLAAIAEMFDDDQVKVDRSVHNPARICKVPGSWACKGDSTPDRPHRVAKPLEIPVDAADVNRVEVVPTELLEALAAELPNDAESSSSSTRQSTAPRN